MTTEYRIEYRTADDERWYYYSADTDSPDESFEAATSYPENCLPNNAAISEWRLVKVTTEVVRTATRERKTP
jgi:hypothetical protein